jgi:hypothetical protein
VLGWLTTNISRVMFVKIIILNLLKVVIFFLTLSLTTDVLSSPDES